MAVLGIGERAKLCDFDLHIVKTQDGKDSCMECEIRNFCKRNYPTLSISMLRYKAHSCTELIGEKCHFKLLQ